MDSNCSSVAPVDAALYKRASNKARENRQKLMNILQIQRDIQKRKQELLEKQIMEQKLLLERIEKGAWKKEQVKATMMHLNALAESLTKDIAVNTKVVLPSTKEEITKKLLDAELDLMMEEQKGGDTAELKKYVEELRQAESRKTTKARYNNTGFVSSPQTNLDKRTRCILVSMESGQNDDVLNIVSQWSEVERTEADGEGVVVHFKTRRDAENKMRQEGCMRESGLSASWYEPPMEEDEEIHTSDEEILLASDDEEERSWRR